MHVERSRLDGTHCETRGADCAAVSLGLAVASELTAVMLTLARDRLLENACESSDFAVINSF